MLTSVYVVLLSVYLVLLPVERNQLIQEQNHPILMLLSLFAAALLARSLLLGLVLPPILAQMLVLR